MATKTVTIMEDAYEILKALKTPEESFSDEIRRLLSAKGGIMELAGAWKDISEEESHIIKHAIKRMKKGTRLLEIAKRV